MIDDRENKLINLSNEEHLGHEKTRALVVPHLFMGDQILNVPVVRYLSTIYDKVDLLCIKKYSNVIRSLYDDNHNISIIETLNDWWHNTDTYKCLDIKKYNVKDIYVAGINLEYLPPYLPFEQIKCDFVPFCFYRHMNLPNSVFWNYFQINENYNSHTLTNLIMDIPYVFTHMETGNKGQIFTVQDVEKHMGQSSDNILFIEPNTNLYPIGHKFHNIADKFVGHYINDYIQVIINAPYIYLTDSCFFCLSMRLGIKTHECYIRKRSESSYNYLWSDNFGFDSKQKGYGSNESMKIFREF